MQFIIYLSMTKDPCVFYWTINTIMRLHEIHSRADKITAIKKFTKWAKNKLNLSSSPKIRLSNNKEEVRNKRTFGTTQASGEVWVYLGNRNTADILRTLVHELVHCKQFSNGTANIDMDKKENLRIEDEANAMAGRLMREYGKKNVDIYEGRTGSMQDGVARALPATYAIPELKNQDPYLQYRFGVAIAGAKGAAQRKQDNVPEYNKESAWGENEIIVSYGIDMDHIIDDALSQLGLHGKRRLSTVASEESDNIGISSPLKAFKGYKRK